MPGQTPQQNQGGHVTLSGEQLGELLRQTGEAAANAATQASTQAFSMLQQQLQRALEVTAPVDLDPGFSWDKKLLNRRQGSRPFADYAKEFRMVSAKADFGGRGLSSILRNSLSRELKAKVSMEDVSGLGFTALVEKLLHMDQSLRSGPGRPRPTTQNAGRRTRQTSRAVRRRQGNNARRGGGEPVFSVIPSHV